ncbi:MAG TPA: hypothetical protein VK445_10695, partial [Dissulfurispiraceae bacterium]|nr:hypothetical protein [Dissulfurispiraceae bacterium]
MLTAAGSTPHIHIPFQRIEEHICLIADRKLNLEIYFSAEVLDAADERRLELIHELLSYGPDISFHAPFMDLCPAALDARIREVTRARFEQTFTAASIFKPKCIVFHSGYEKWKYSLKFEPWLENSMSFWAPLIERASILNTKIAIENIFENE